jgi:hypothetical protein
MCKRVVTFQVNKPLPTAFRFFWITEYLPANLLKCCLNEIYRRARFHTGIFCDWIGVAIRLYTKHFKQPKCLCSI